MPPYCLFVPTGNYCCPQMLGTKCYNEKRSYNCCHLTRFFEIYVRSFCGKFEFKCRLFVPAGFDVLSSNKESKLLHCRKKNSFIIAVETAVV